MSEPILVQPVMPKAYVSPSMADSLIEDLKSEGLDAWLAYEEFGGGGAVWEYVVLWVANSAGPVVLAAVIEHVIHWLSQPSKHPDDPRPRAVERPRAVDIRVYEGDWSELHVTVKKEPTDKEPVRITPEDSAQWMPRKPIEGVYPLVNPGDRVRVRALPGLEISQRYAGQLGRVVNYPTMNPGGDYSILMDDGTEIPLRREAFTPAETDESGGLG